MSKENVEIVRRHIEAWSAEEAALALSFLDPHIVLDLTRAGEIEGAVYGHDGISNHFRRWAGTFEGYRWEVQRLDDLGTGAVLAVVTESGQGKGSGVSVNRPLAALYTLIGGKIVRITMFPDEREALEAAGLEEQAMSQENVEIARRAFDEIGVLAESGEPDEIETRLTDAVLEELCDPEVEWVPVPQGLLAGGSYVGYEGIRRFAADFFAAWDELDFEPQKFRDIGSDRVVVTMKVRGRMNELEVDEVWSSITTLRNGRIVRHQAFTSEYGALEAAGLTG